MASQNPLYTRAIQEREELIDALWKSCDRMLYERRTIIDDRNDNINDNATNSRKNWLGLQNDEFNITIAARLRALAELLANSHQNRIT